MNEENINLFAEISFCNLYNIKDLEVNQIPNKQTKIKVIYEFNLKSA